MRQRAGFTLIEVMIAIAIVAILAAVAIPSYSEYVRRARITDATKELSGMRVKMEQYFQDNRTYAGACQGGTIAPLPASTASFSFACPAPLDATQYTVEANGIAGTTMANAKYTINQANQRVTVTAPSGWLNQNCGWVIKKDGSC